MTEDHRDGCQCHGCVCSRYELEIHSLMNDIEHERDKVAKLRSVIEYEYSKQCMESNTQNRRLFNALEESE